MHSLDDNDITGGQEPVGVPIRFPNATHRLRLENTLTRYYPEPLLEDETPVSSLREPGAGCQCDPKSDCTEDCSCIEEHGYFYDASQQLQIDSVPGRHPLFECSDSCSCSPHSCRNRISQRGVRLQLEVRSTSRGLGLFAAQPIGRGHFVCLYAGEIISSAEAKFRWIRRQLSRDDNYVLVLRETVAGGTILKTIVDPTNKGNVGRFINHSCPPLTNLIVLPIRPAGQLIPLPAMFATRDISPGEELGFDYADASGATWRSPPDPAAADSDTGGLTKCLCGSPSCRGFMPFDASL